MDIEELIYAIEKRPLMYMEEVHIDYIFYIVKGYLSGALADNSKNITFHSKFYRWLVDWINKNTGYCFELQDGFYWNNILTQVTSSNQEAVELFFKLCRVFFNECYKRM